ncbi:(2Fe-2S)-binding protein [Sphingomonas abietis]|uniref:Bacterioferritin-associated ferredoxin n=1 Tax=Sphingomonas abietis TaxID=3012344 RepID=A0ABY7NQY5_9SPHN|nr:(2Fe-2S)-binding protein [Sphingomonas abietis]WBO23375.1 (2Fe-2S)-binding protein [Sphingomonas abietis]
MVVCVCNALREQEVREAARSGCRDPLSAYAALGCRPRCGQCVPFARELIANEQAAA